MTRTSFIPSLSPDTLGGFVQPTLFGIPMDWGDREMVRCYYWINGIRTEDYAVACTDHQAALRIVKLSHYAKGGSNTGIAFHGLFHVDDLDNPLGVAWWLPPAPGAAAKASPDAPHRAAGLHRLAILPHVPLNAATHLIAASRALLFAEGRYVGLVTYADTGVVNTLNGRPNDGGIYLGSGWKKDGETKSKHPTWLDENGAQVSPKRGPKTLTKAEMLARGYRMYPPSLKYRFIVRKAA